MDINKVNISKVSFTEFEDFLLENGEEKAALEFSEINEYKLVYVNSVLSPGVLNETEVVDFWHRLIPENKFPNYFKFLQKYFFQEGVVNISY